MNHTAKQDRRFGIRWIILAVLLAGVGACLNGCSTITVPPTAGEQARYARGYGYKPFDPLPVIVKGADGATAANILRALPDETMRIAVGASQGSAGVTYGPASIGYAGSNYVVVLDFVKYTTMPLRLKRGNEVKGSITNIVYTLAPTNTAPDIVIPAYVGVGVRLQADIHVKAGSVNLGSLAAIGLAAQASKVTGTLVVQSLGISGNGVSSSMVISSDINPTTIQNALVAMGTIKSKVYDTTTGISIMPRVLGVYDVIGGGPDTINGYISMLLEHPLELDPSTGSLKYAPL